jgi:hypothetical protein
MRGAHGGLNEGEHRSLVPRHEARRQVHLLQRSDEGLEGAEDMNDVHRGGVTPDFKAKPNAHSICAQE